MANSHMANENETEIAAWQAVSRLCHPRGRSGSTMSRRRFAACTAAGRAMRSLSSPRVHALGRPVLRNVWPGLVALRQMQQHDCHTMPVVRRGHLIGLVTMDNVGEFLSVQAALGKRLVTHQPHVHSKALASAALRARPKMKAVGIARS
jgi:CBS-domain-containing membrane protein